MIKEINKIYQGDCLEVLKTFPDESINCCMTSPPYWALRDYGTANWEGGDINCNHINGTLMSNKSTLYNEIKDDNKKRTTGMPYKEICGKCGAKRVDKQLGLEDTFQEYINKLCDIFDEVKRVLRKDGTCWVNIGDTYFGGGNNRGNNSPISDKQKSNRGANGQVQKDWKKCRDDCKQLDIKFNTKRKFCNNCGKEFDAMPGQYFCGSACSGVDNTKRELKGKFPDKTLCNIPARFSIEMQNRGWILRNVIIWHKPNCMPSSVKDRFTVDFEYLYFFVKSKKYWFETQFEDSLTPGSKSGTLKENMSEPTGKICGYNHSGKDFITSDKRNKRAVWKIATKPFKEAHFATYPEALCETPIKAGCPVGGIVLDPFFGAGTTGLVAMKQNKNFIGIELNPEYCKIANERIQKELSQTKLNKGNNGIPPKPKDLGILPTII